MSAEQRNLFLAALSPASRDLLLSHCTAMPLPLKTVLYEAEQTPDYAYFITSGIASVVTVMADGSTAEVGLIGHEGLVGSLHLLGPGIISTSCYIQLEATGLRIAYSDLLNSFNSSSEIRALTLEFVQTQTSSLGQLAGCHRLHEAEERLARWLLMAQDRTQSDVLHFTQEFLAMMLGSRRTTVTLVAGSLQRSGLIEYQRGRVKILNRANLEDAACECYPIVGHLFHSLYKQNKSPNSASPDGNHARNIV